jgi:uncharacterized membrane protein
MNQELDVAVAQGSQESRPVERKGIDAHITTLGHILFAVGLMSVGVLSLRSGDFAYSWQPVPDWVIWRAGLARLSGLLLFATGITLLTRRAARSSAIIMGVYLALLMFALHLPRVMLRPMDVGRWLGFGENLTLVCGGWIVALAVSRHEPVSPLKLWSNPRLPQLLYAGACVVFGVSHFVYAEATAGMAPPWLPYRFSFAYLTGAGHLTAGLAMLVGIVPALAATLEASMITSFVLLVHIPGVLSEPHSRMQWTMLGVASALGGATWLIAGSLRRPISRERDSGLSLVTLANHVR